MRGDLPDGGGGGAPVFSVVRALYRFPARLGSSKLALIVLALVRWLSRCVLLVLQASDAWMVRGCGSNRLSRWEMMVVNEGLERR